MFARCRARHLRLLRPSFAALAVSMLGSLGFGQVFGQVFGQLAPATMAPVAPTESLAPAPAFPAWQWQVVDRHEIDCGDQTLIFNRVVPPQLKPTTASGASGASGAAGAVPAAAVAPVASPPAKPAPKPAAARPLVTLFLAAAVGPDGTSELRCSLPPGGEHVFRSSIDFRQFEGVTTVAGAGADYFLVLTVAGRAGAAELSAAGRESVVGDSCQVAAEPTATASAAARFVAVAVPPAGPDPALLLALADLHRFYDLNRDRLAADYRDAQARRFAEQDAAPAAAPARKPDTTIYYFPVRSVYAPPAAATDSAGETAQPGGAR